MTTDALTLPFRALHIAEPRLTFGYGQSEEYTRRGLYLYGPLDSDEVLGPIRYGFVGPPEGLLLSPSAERGQGVA